MIADQVEVGMVEEDAKATRPQDALRPGHAAGLAPHHRAFRSQYHQGLHGAGPNLGWCSALTTSSSWTSARCTGTAKATPGTPSWSAPIPTTTRPRRTSGPSGTQVRDRMVRQRDHRPRTVRLRHRDDRGLRVEAEPRPLRPPAVRLTPTRPTTTDRWPTSTSGRTRICGCSRLPSPIPTRHLRGLLRGSAARGPVLPAARPQLIAAA